MADSKTPFTRSSKYWGPPPHVDGPGGRWFGPGEAVGTDSLSGAVSELIRQHPWDVQGTDLPHERYNARHQPVNRVYGDRADNRANGHHDRPYNATALRHNR